MQKISTVKKHITAADLFAFVNVLLFLGMCYSVYYDKFVSYRGITNIHEFFIYATIIFLTICFFWIRLRRVKIDIAILMAFEIIILIHFSGAFINIEGKRLYDFHILGIRYDKFVHFINSYIGFFIAYYFFRLNRFPDNPIALFVAVLTVLGVGGIIEIAEFFVTLTVPHNGVGDYINNMSDLVSNLIGSILAAVSYRLYST